MAADTGEPAVTEIQPVCDVCGKPAINWARDFLRHEAPGEYYVQYSPIGVLKAGCDEHPAQSEEFLTQLPAPKSQR
jgi:hypothetical protein